MTTKPKVQIWVHPEYKNKIKAQAAKKGLGILEFTKNEALSSDCKDILVKKVKPKKQHDPFNFQL